MYFKIAPTTFLTATTERQNYKFCILMPFFAKINDAFMLLNGLKYYEYETKFKSLNILIAKV